MKRAGRRLFTYSLSYLFIIFLALLTDHWATIWGCAVTFPRSSRRAALARRRRRSIALGLALGAAALLFYVLTIVKMGPAIFDRAL